jgi:hypothetical protein
LKLAAAIAKGSGVDWNRVVLKPEERNLIEELQIIERIAGIHRSQDRHGCTRRTIQQRRARTRPSKT